LYSLSAFRIMLSGKWLATLPHADGNERHPSRGGLEARQQLRSSKEQLPIWEQRQLGNAEQFLALHGRAVA
jgi:hypothetical protein